MLGFNTAVSGLLSSQRSLYVTSHNFSNATTPGYSRQIAYQRATDPYYAPGVGYIGTGTEIYDVRRVRNSYVDYKYWSENGSKGEWETKAESLKELETLFGEPSDNSFRQYMDDFFQSLEDLTTNPSDSSFREPVREAALALTKHINETAERLVNVKEETSFQIEAQVKKVNDIAAQISSLNGQIYSLEIDGKTANDLRDRRELLVDDLSKIVNVQVNEYSDGKYRVSIGGIALVNHKEVSEIKYESELQWANGNALNLKSGSLKALQELYEGNGENNTYRGINFYINKLNTFAQVFADTINEQHKDGVTLDAADITTGSEIDFFKISDSANPALTLTLSDEVLESVSNIAARAVGTGVENADNLQAIIKLRENKTFFSGGVSQGTPDDFLKSIISNLAVDSTHGKRMDSNEEQIINNIREKRESESGVSTEEETTNMIRFLNSYRASSEMISTLDQILDVVVNRLGTAGR
jgi:flagellar hook-associated protein 1 FlgK